MRSHHFSDQTADFLRLFWTSQNQNSVIFELPRAHVRLSAPLVATLAEAADLALRMENPRNIVLLPPEAGDQSDRVISDNEKLAQDIDSAFEPGGTLNVKEDVLEDDISDASASTSDAAVDDISKSNDDLSNTKPARKRRKNNLKETTQKGVYN